MLNTAKQVAIAAISAALFAVFFFLSYLVALPNFTFLYLPIILLGVFPIWFGWGGLVGSMFGGLIGGIFVENLGYFAWVEVTVAFIIYVLNWILLPREATELRTERSGPILVGVYALTLFVGTCVILGQFVLLGLFPLDVAALYILPTFALNVIIVAVACPVLIKTLSPRMKNWGMYSGTFADWRSPRSTKT
jgi:hypothetical protein